MNALTIGGEIGSVADGSRLSRELLAGLGVPEAVCNKLETLGLFTVQSTRREIDFSLDSAAVVTIIPRGDAHWFPLEDTTSGTVYKNCSGGDVPDDGMRRLTGNVSGQRRGVKARVGPVKKPLMALCELIDSANGTTEVTVKKDCAVVVNKAGEGDHD